ncbi:hypothetical protein NDU88_000285 [Pleurodeles waltl]|uniref:Uncharacterized protein n=1 Tax=Pleurodeles waltl TaxID=8319 RepID=A0AAV7MK13_PLEWA|nr:hypothetical protein NDU88_000285 [Pleurodeles waltl]
MAAHSDQAATRLRRAAKRGRGHQLLAQAGRAQRSLRRTPEELLMPSTHPLDVVGSTVPVQGRAEVGCQAASRARHLLGSSKPSQAAQPGEHRRCSSSNMGKVQRGPSHLAFGSERVAKNLSDAQRSEDMDQQPRPETALQTALVALQQSPRSIGGKIDSLRIHRDHTAATLDNPPKQGMLQQRTADSQCPLNAIRWERSWR